MNYYLQTCRPDCCLYKIKPQDTLYGISTKFNTTVSEILKINPFLQPKNLIIGQKILIPIPQTTTKYKKHNSNMRCYKIKKGDTLYSISMKFNIPLSSLIKANPHINANNLYLGQKIYISDYLKTYQNTDFNISLRYPSSWEKIEDGYYKGETGYFIISAISSDKDIQDVCRNEAFNKFQPYGSNPKIIKTEIDDQDGCLIIPSHDQRKEFENQAALIVEYPEPITIGDMQYNYFILLSNKEFIQIIANSVEFIDD